VKEQEKGRGTPRGTPYKYTAQEWLETKRELALLARSWSLRSSSTPEERAHRRELTDADVKVVDVG